VNVNGFPAGKWLGQCIPTSYLSGIFLIVAAHFAATGLNRFVSRTGFAIAALTANLKLRIGVKADLGLRWPVIYRHE
jgi:hypothetical protein